MKDGKKKSKNEPGPSPTVRHNISLPGEVDNRALTLMRIRAFSEFSDFVATLIREECDRRFPNGLPPVETKP